MIFSLLKFSIFITVLIVGILLAIGYIYTLIEKRNTLYLYSTLGNLGILLTGIIGTTIHELGHIIMCFLFNHKITDFQLFNFKGYKSDTTLGYVSHRYNERNLYQKAGNFFIGVAPMISGTLVIIVSFKLLLPDIFNTLDISNYFKNISYIDIKDIIILLLNLTNNLFSSLFNINNFTNVNFYIFIYLMFCICSHISLSKQDFKNSSVGIFSLFIIIFIIYFINFTVYNTLNTLWINSLKFIIFITFFLCIGLIFSLISLCISFVIYKIKKW